MKIIAEKWKDYFNKVLPKTATGSEFMEARRAFYAGSGVMLEYLMEISTSLDEKKALEALNEALRESDQFTEEVKKGEK